MASLVNEPSGTRTRDPLLERLFRGVRTIHCLRGFSLSSNDFAETRPSEVFTRDHASPFLLRYKNRYKSSHRIRW